MDRSLDEIAAEMHSAQVEDPLSSRQAYKEGAFIGAEHSVHKRSSSNSRRYAPYPEPHSLNREDSGRPFFRKTTRGIGEGNLEPTDRLFVGNISFTTSWQTLKGHMRRGN